MLCNVSFLVALARMQFCKGLTFSAIIMPNVVCRSMFFTAVYASCLTAFTVPLFLMAVSATNSGKFTVLQYSVYVIVGLWGYRVCNI